VQVNVSPLLDAAMWDLEIQGKTAVCVAVDGAIRGVLGLADTAKGGGFQHDQSAAGDGSGRVDGELFSLFDCSWF
jgi:hypothetical protein